jgi:hypothetical protein
MHRNTIAGRMEKDKHPAAKLRGIKTNNQVAHNQNRRRTHEEIHSNRTHSSHRACQKIQGEIMLENFAYICALFAGIRTQNKSGKPFAIRPTAQYKLNQGGSQ